MSPKKIMAQEPIKIVLALLLTLVLVFPSQHNAAFAEVISGQEEGRSADTSITLDKGASNEDALNGGPAGSPEKEGSVTDDAPAAELTMEDAASDIAATANGETVSPFAVATVTTETAFRAALADVTITEIYLGADISMSSSTAATVANRTLVISGVDPADPTATVHTYSDYPSIVAGSTSLQGTCVDLTFRDINVSLSNYYGIYGTTVSNKTVTFDNVTGTAPQFFHYFGSSAGSVFIVKDSNLTLGSGYLSVTGELAEADRVIFQGNTTVTRTSSSVNNIFYLAGTYASVTVEDGANVVVDNSANGTAAGAIFYTTRTVNIGNNATFNCYTGQGFMGSGSAAISVGQYSNVKFIYTGTSARSSYYLQATSFSVGLQSNVLVYDNSSATNGAFYVPGSVTLNNPQSFVVLNANRAAMAPGIATNLTGTEITSIRYFNSASQIAGVYDPANREYIGTDASPFARWWVQNAPFNVSANNWPSNTPTGVTTSPLYSSANVPAPALAAGAETTLTASNFGLNTSTAYGVAFMGETNANVTLEYFFDGVIDPTRTTTITPSLLSTVNVSDVALATTPLGYTLSSTPTSPTLPASALSLDNTTVSVFYVTDSAQTASIMINYYFNSVHDASMDATIMPQILATVDVSDVALATPPSGYILSTVPTLPTLPASAQSLDGQTVNVYYVTDPGQVATINIEYFFDGTHNAALDTSIMRQALASVNLTDVLLATVPVGYRLSSTPTSPILPATAQSLDGQTVSVYYVTDPQQTATIHLNYYFNGTHNTSFNTAITPQILATVNLSDVTLSTVPAGYMLSSIPTLPTLPASAQSLNGQTVNIYYVTDPAQTATINIQYYIGGIHDVGRDTSITRQALTSVTLADVELIPPPVGYTLDPDPTNPTLPQTAYTLDGTTISVFYVLDLGQTATIDVGYYFNGVLNASYSTTINPQILATVTQVDVVLSTTPDGYMLDTTSTSPVLPESAQTLNGTTINVYYVADPAQTATINIQYNFDGVHDTARDTSISRQVLSAVDLADVALVSVPTGYTLAAAPTSPVLPQIALSLDGTTVSVFYVTDAAQTATISVGYYFNGTLDASYSTTINPQFLATVNLSDVTLATVPTGYMLSSTPTSPVLPQSAQSLDGTTINVFYVTDPAQTTTITLNYYFNGTHNTSFDTSITPQVLSSVSLADVTLTPTPVGYMLDAIPTAPVLPERAQLLDGSIVNVYYVTNPNQTATINIAYYLNGVLNPAYNATITPHILEQVAVADVALDTPPVGYMLDTVPTSPVLPQSAQSLDGTTINVFYVTDPSQTATITLNYFFNGTHNASYDTTITPQVLTHVTQSDVVLASTPSGFMLATPATSPALPASALSLNNTTVNIYYVSISERITASNFRYPIASGKLTSADTIFLAQVIAYDTDGNLIPASSITVDAAQLAAINAAIAAGDTSDNPFPLTFYTPDGTAITIEVTLFGEEPPEEEGEELPIGEQEPSESVIPKVGDWSDMDIVFVGAGTLLAVLLLALYRFRRVRIALK